MTALRKASNTVPFQDKYTRLEKVGRGKFADVYKCELIGENDHR